MNEAVYAEIFAVEDRHWWFRAKRQIVMHLLNRFAAPRPGEQLKVVDLGCGCGATLYQLQLRYHAIGVDGSPLAVDFCSRRGIDVQLAELPHGIQISEGSVDAVLLLDVLEHVDDHAGSLRAAAKLLRPGGVLICTVPAYQWLWSWWDEIHHHYRRYTLTSLKKVLSENGLEPQMMSYVNTLLFPIAMVARLFARLKKPPAEGTCPMHVPAAPVNYVLNKIYAGERHLLGKVRLPFGLSVVGVARKPNAPQTATKDAVVPKSKVTEQEVSFPRPQPQPASASSSAAR